MPKLNGVKVAKSSAPLIANIYAYLVLAIGVSVLAVSVYLLVKNITGRALLEKYPVGYEESRCDMYTQPYYPPMEAVIYPGATPISDQATSQKTFEDQNKKAKDECLAQLDEIRGRKASTDLYEALALILVGVLLVVPHAVFAYKLRR